MSILGAHPYYHGTVRKFVSAFGELFSGVTIINKDADCNPISIVKVPIAYGPKNKWLERLRAQPDLNAPKTKVTLPRISFEITDYRYDPVRKIGTQGAFIPGRIGEKGAKLFNPVPYDVIIKMYTYAKDNDDSLQMLEQILPFFAPYLEVTFEQIPELSFMKTVPVMLDGVAVDDNYSDMNVQSQRTVVQTFSFTAKLDFFGPVFSSESIIKKIDIDIATKTPGVVDVSYSAEVSPMDAKVDDKWEVIEGWE